MNSLKDNDQLTTIHKDELKHLYAMIVENLNKIKKLESENMYLKLQLGESKIESLTVNYQLSP